MIGWPHSVVSRHIRNMRTHLQDYLYTLHRPLISLFHAS
jgi:hypothetical protein